MDARFSHWRHRVWMHSWPAGDRYCGCADPGHFRQTTCNADRAGKSKFINIMTIIGKIFMVFGVLGFIYRSMTDKPTSIPLILYLITDGGNKNGPI